MTYIQNRGLVDLNNSTTVPLAGGATFDGAWTDCSPFASITVSALTDAGVAGQVTLQFSQDGAAVHGFAGPWPFEASGSIGIPKGVIPTAQFYRVKVENLDVAAQTVLNLQTIINPNARIAIPTSRVAQRVNDYSDLLNTRAILNGELPSGDYANITLKENAALRVALADSLSAFGEIRVVKPQPIFQIDAVYGIDPDLVETFTNGTGSVSASEGNFVCQTGAGVGGYGVIRSRRVVRYRSGQGALYRFTAIFDKTNAVPNSLQAAGVFNSTNGFFVGYDGTDFGVMHRTGGRHEVRTLSITVAASGAETLNLVLNGVAYNIPVTAGSTQKNAYEVETWLNANQSVWDAQQAGSTVVLMGQNPEPLSGAYSVSNGGGTVAGSIVQTKAGVVNTETWTLAPDFNVDSLDGSGPSGMILDQTKGNVFEVVQQYLGYGAVDFRVENPLTGQFFTFHQFRFANSRTTPTVLNPSLKGGWVAASLGSSTNLTVLGASALGAIEGGIHPFHRPRGFTNQRTGVAGTLVSLFAIQVRNTLNGVVQLGEVLPSLISVSPEGNKAVEVKILLNPTFNAAVTVPNWQYVDQNFSTVLTDVVGTALSSTGREIASFIVAGGDTGSLNFARSIAGEVSETWLARGDILVVAGRILGGAGSNVTGSITWLEE